MTVTEICNQVRWCYDEEALNASSLVTSYGDGSDDNALMNNIIKSKIADALRWVSLHSPAELLGGSDEEEDDVPVDTGIIVDATLTNTQQTDNGVNIEQKDKYLLLTMPANFLRLVRVRVDGWHRAVKRPIGEDTDEYLQLYDSDGATATADRPQAALIEKAQREIELWPKGGETYKVEVTYISDPGDAESFVDEEASETPTDDHIHYPLPPRVKPAFIYYLAFLTLSAYEDGRAARMLEIAKLSLGLTGDNQRA